MVTGYNVPIGYNVPSFPSLHTPGEGHIYQLSYLYYTFDIWRFTLYWSLIFSVSFHLCAALMAIIMHKKVVGSIWILVVYLGIAGVESFISGSIIGLLIAAIYKAGMFGMSTWIPFVWGLIQILFMVITSYSMMSTVL